MRIKGILAAAAMLFAGLFTGANATPITYTLSGTLDAMLGATTVTGASFTWTMTGDTASALNAFPGVIYVPAITSTINISGIGTLTTTDLMAFGAEPAGNLYGMIAPFTPEGIIFGSAGTAGYNGLSAWGPTLTGFTTFSPIATDHGDLSVSYSGDFLVFQATGGDIPEPVTLALFGAGLAGIGVLRRRKA